jgi:hypothetical protein
MAALPLFLVDGFNFLHAVVLRGRDRAQWWSPDKQGLVIDWLARHGGGEPAELWVVFDQRGSSAGVQCGGARIEQTGPPRRKTRPPRPSGRVRFPSLEAVRCVDVEALPGSLRVYHAPDADADILARCAELAGTREVIVVSADRSLCDRARGHGARRVSPWKFAASRVQTR